MQPACHAPRLLHLRLGGVIVRPGYARATLGMAPDVPPLRAAEPPPHATPPNTSQHLPTPAAQLTEGRSAADLAELVRRIRVVHAASLNGQNRKGLQLLYGILVQHFASLAGGGRGGQAAALPHLDALVQPLLELTPQVGPRMHAVQP